MSTAVQNQRQNRHALEAELKAAGATIRGNSVTCVFHDDQHASGSIYQGTDGSWRFKCQASSCGFCGDVYDVRAKVTGRHLADILREANPQARTPQQHPTERVCKDLSDLRLAVSRPWPIEAEYHYTDPDTGKTDLLVFRLLPPPPKKKEFRQCCPVPGGWLMKAPPKPWPLFRRDKIRQVDQVLVVEGEKKADALNAVGITATTSPCGAGKAEHADWSPLAGKQVWLWPDNDANGTGRAHMKDVQALLDRLNPAPTIRFIEPNDLDLGDKEDAYDFIEQCKIAGVDPKQAVLDAMKQAKSISPSSGLHDRMEAIINGKWTDVPLPWSLLTKLSRPTLPQTVTVLCGPPGGGKSIVVYHSLLHWFDSGVPFACLSLEDDSTYHLYRALAILERNINLLDIEWQKSHAEEARAARDKHKGYLDRFAKRITDAPVEPKTLGEIAKWIEDRAREGCRVIVVDPVTAAVAEDKPYIADTKFVNSVKATMLAHNASLLLVTHPRKGRGVSCGMDDLAGGAAYQRLSHCVLWIDRHPKPKSVAIQRETGRFETEIDQTVHICKARNGRGHGLSLGFKIDWPKLEFAEQGVIVK